MGALTATALRQAGNGASYLDRNRRMKPIHPAFDPTRFTPGTRLYFCNNLSVDLEGTGLKEDKPIILEVMVSLLPYMQ